MRTMKPVHDATCAVACSAEIIGSKWTALLVHDLSEGARRFSELEHACPGISPRTLSERLRWLEQEGVLVAAQLRRDAAARRVRADAQGNRAAADHRADAPLRPRLARRRPRASHTPRARRRAAASGRRRAPARRRRRAGCARPAAARSASAGSLRAASKPVTIVGIPLSARAGTIGSVPPERSSSGRTPERALERVLAEPDRGRVRRDQAGRRGRPELDLDLGALGRRLAEQALELGGERRRPAGPGASRIERFASATTGITVFWSCGEPPSTPLTSTDGSAQVRR